MPKHKRSARTSHAGKVLWITQDGKIDLYVVEDARPDPSVAFPVLHLTKADGTQYTVSVDQFGAACTCPDCTYRQHACRHIKALRAVQLIGSHGYHDEAGE